MYSFGEQTAKQTNIKTCYWTQNTKTIIEPQRVNSAPLYLLSAVLLQTVEQLVHVREPEGQQLKVFLVTLKQKQLDYIHLQQLSLFFLSFTDVTFVVLVPSQFFAW